MLAIYINGSNRTSDVEYGTLKITNQLQQRSDNCSFTIISGSKPTENDDIKIYVYDEISGITANTITLTGLFEQQVGRFYANQVIYLDIGATGTFAEKATVQSYTESTLTLVLTATPTGSYSPGDKVGVLIFGGVISRVQDKNIKQLTDIEYDITAVDYTKVFDKKLISDTWEDVDARYIINDFTNTTVNFNSTIDNMAYDDNTAIQAEYIESGDGNNPTVDSSDFLEATASAVFSWTNSGGTATWSGTPTSKNVASLVGVSSGTPTEGALMLWVKTADFASITNLVVRIGSDSSNYAAVTIPLVDSTDWNYYSVNLDAASITGTPDWTAVDYAAFIVTETANGSVKLNGLRINAENSFTLYNVSSTINFTDIRSPQLKPTAFTQRLAKSLEYIWYIDYERDIHFQAIETEDAPFNLTESTNNFTDLRIKVDQSQLANRVIVRGGEKTSDSTYSQVFEGGNDIREWLLKSKFNNLVVSVDNNSSTDTMEAGTTTTNVTATGHGLITGDYIVNRDRSNAVRQITKVNDDNFTVEAVTGQTSGDTFSKFLVSKTVGIEGITDETTVDYVANSNEKSVRATNSEATLIDGEFILFVYNERVPIQVQYTNTVSANALKARGLGDGIFDADPITDRNIQDVGTAIAIAEAKVNEFSNPIIDGTFSTDQFGLSAGQIIEIIDSNRSLSEEYVIQKVSGKQAAGQYNDYFEYTVTFGTTLFGYIEFFQKLLATKDSIELNTDDIVETYVAANETVESDDANQTATDGGFKNAKNTETVEASEANTVVDYPANQWKFEPSVGQPLPSRFNLASYA